MDIKSFTQLVNSAIQYTDIKGQLNELSHSSQLMIMRSLSPKIQRLLWTLCEGQEADLNDLVPSGTPTGQPVRHYGKNTLPVFSLFEKDLCVLKVVPFGDIMKGKQDQSLAQVTSYVAKPVTATLLQSIL